MSNLSVAKFGGTSVANFEAMSACANIVMADKNTRVVVLSASAGVTNYLVELANGCESARRAEILAAVRTIQFNIINQLQQPEAVAKQIEDILQHLTALAESASLATSAALTDELICHGEMMSTRIFTQLLNEKITLRCGLMCVMWLPQTAILAKQRPMMRKPNCKPTTC